MVEKDCFRLHMRSRALDKFEQGGLTEWLECWI